MIKIKGIIVFVIITILTSVIFQNKCVLEMVSHFTLNLNNFQISRKLEQDKNEPTFAIFSKSKSETHLVHVLSVLQKLGFQRVSIEEDWNLLWSHDFPFRHLKTKMKSLSSHQKVNHFPGSGYITNKVDLSVSNFVFQPKSFRLPNDKAKLKNYSKLNFNKLFVEKHNEHRQILIKKINNIDLNSQNIFVQEFINNPYLVDGYKFDIGVYVILTSVNPIRIYIYSGDVLFRFCTQKYYPFNSSVVEKYVVADNYLPYWQIPSLKKYHNLKFGMRDSFDEYVKSQNQNPKIIWEQIEDIIRQTVLTKEKKLIKSLKHYNASQNFFELIRFDFVLDEKMRVWLMEANMSPNLSSAHFKHNSILYEQLLYSLMVLVGVGSPIRRNNIKKKTISDETMVSSEKNLVVFGSICISQICQFNCDDFCKFCLNCLSKTRIDSLHTAFREHMHKTQTKRIFPKPIMNYRDYKIEEEIKDLSEENKFIVSWFYGKCQMDSSWCL